jgi:hypothetical protein
VVGAQDLARLGIGNRFPVYKEQLTVLLPAGGHRGRINARLRVTAPIGLVKVTASVLLSAYEDAYSILGNYSGASEGAIKMELLNIVSECIGR